MDSFPDSATVALLLDCDGYVLLRGVLADAAVERAAGACAVALERRAAAGSVLAGHRGAAYGARNLLRLWPDAVDLLRSDPLAAILADVLGCAAGVVRGLFFDKPPGATWSLPWHRDMTIAVKRHLPGPKGTVPFSPANNNPASANGDRRKLGQSPCFRKPTVKAGVPHVEAPAELLAAMLTARVHLDAVTMQNGPLQVVPGSHRLDAAPRPVETILCAAGDVLLMRPLLSHASIQCADGCTEHRRIVHLEMSPVQELPDGYEWHDWLPLSGR